MLGALAAADASVRTTFEEASAVLGFDLWKLVSEGPEEALDATEHTQPAMLAAGVATWRVWRARGGALPAVVSGHSLGEFTALVCAEGLPFGATVDLVRFRGQIMQEAVPAGSGAMAAILGLDDEAVEAACRRPRKGPSWKRPISTPRARWSLPVRRRRCSARSKRPGHAAPSARWRCR